MDDYLLFFLRIIRYLPAKRKERGKKEEKKRKKEEEKKRNRGKVEQMAKRIWVFSF